MIRNMLVLALVLPFACLGVLLGMERMERWLSSDIAAGAAKVD
jgi:hypothetical protein